MSPWRSMKTGTTNSGYHERRVFTTRDNLVLVIVAIVEVCHRREAESTANTLQRFEGSMASKVSQAIP